MTAQHVEKYLQFLTSKAPDTEVADFSETFPQLKRQAKVLLEITQRKFEHPNVDFTTTETVVLLTLMTVDTPFAQANVIGLKSHDEFIQYSRNGLELATIQMRSYTVRLQYRNNVPEVLFIRNT